jgi:DNA (cytosine-5)-methyltransferase 1
MRSKEQISSIMAKVKSKDTKPETKLRDALIERGIVFSDESVGLPGKPDLLLSDNKIAIFVDGDFWHGNQWQTRGFASLEDQFQESNTKDYWVKKIQGNIIRDSKVTYELFESGWVVIRLWESQINDDLETCVNIVLDTIQKKTHNPRTQLLSEKSFAEFFSGIGLMRMGMENKGWNYKFANDFDPEKIKMYNGHFAIDDHALSSEDIHKLSPEIIPTVTLATASFPCNDLSLAGARQGLNEGKQSSAFWGLIRVIKGMGNRKPPIVLLENVVGFLSSKNGQDFQQALLTLNEMGYSVDTFILDAANFVPQSRKRLFIVGKDTSLEQVKSTNINDGISDARPEALRKFISSHQDINWSIRVLPNQPKLNKFLKDIIEDIPQNDSSWWNPERSSYLLNQMSPKHRAIADKMISNDDISYGTVFRRVRYGKTMAELRTDGIAGCLRTPRGGSGRQILFVAGKGKYYVRLLSGRECARLMGADDFKIDVPLNQALFGFGDAVCVPVIEWIAEHYLNPWINERIHQTSI